jgi:hypothetical protein
MMKTTLPNPATCLYCNRTYLPPSKKGRGGRVRRRGERGGRERERERERERGGEGNEKEPPWIQKAPAKKKAGKKKPSTQQVQAGPIPKISSTSNKFFV